MKRKLFLIVPLLVLLGGTFSVAEAGLMNTSQKTYFTTNAPVRLPSNVILPAGTYLMTLVDPSGNVRNLVRVLSADGSKVYGTFFGMPQYVKQPSDMVQLLFGEAAEGQVEPLQAWYYPGRAYALTFKTPEIRREALSN